MTSFEPDNFNILIVDDTSANLETLGAILSGRGYQVRPCINGEIALNTVRKRQPDLVLLDIRMPDMDGYEVCRRLKTESTTRDIPVIFISALDDTADKVKAFELGGVDYITKPFQSEEVLARVKTHINLQIAIQEMRESEEKFRAIAASAQSAIIMFNEDGEILFWNKAAQTIFGWSSQEAMGKVAHKLLAQEQYNASYEKGLTLFKETGQRPLFDKQLVLALLRKDGKEIFIDAAISTVKLKGKMCVIGIFRDITDRKKADEELKCNIEETERFNRLALGREERIIALKEEVNELLIQAGQEKKYTSV